MAEVAAAKAAEAAVETPEPDRQQSVLIPMLVAAAVIVGAGFATAKFAVVPLIQVDSLQRHEKPVEADHSKGEIVTFENIIVNPAGTKGQRYLKTTIGLEVMDEDSKEALQSGIPRIKDALITLLSARSIDDLADAGNRELIRDAIREEINRRIEPGEVEAVYFLDFVLR